MNSRDRSPGGSGAPPRFHTNVRHYHRSSAVPGVSPPQLGPDGLPLPRKTPKWLKISGIVVGALTLIGIISGLIIELSA